MGVLSYPYLNTVVVVAVDLAVYLMGDL